MATQPKPLRILASCHQMRPSGAPIMLFGLLERLAQKHQVSMLLPGSPDPAFVERYRAAGVHLLDEAVLRDHDVFLGNTLLCSSLVVKVSRKLPTVWWIHEAACGLDFIESGRADAAAFSAATRVIFLSAWQPKALYGRWLETAQWTVVPTAVPAIRRLSRQRPPDTRFRLVHVGAVERRRGQHLMLAALIALGDESLELRLVGGDQNPWAHRLKKALAGKLKVNEQVSWCGALSHEQTLQEIADADAMVLPTLDDVLPLVVLEAMSLGVPVICSDYGALGEELVDGEEALLVPTGDHEALAAAIQRLRCEPVLAQHLVETSRKQVLAKRSHEDLVRAMEGELYAAIEEFRPRASA